MAKHTVDELAGKTDAELLELLGFASQVDEFKEALGEAKALKGKARERIEERVNEMLTPHVYPGDLKYAVKSAKRETATGKEALNDCCCASVLD